jgi:hypothetical protein
MQNAADGARWLGMRWPMLRAADRSGRPREFAAVAGRVIIHVFTMTPKRHRMRPLSVDTPEKRHPCHGAEAPR